jgi:quinone-modifying oxidoreductase subunit QmoA
MTGKPILIIGGGISGITAAVEIAETGGQVVLVEKLPYLGGNVVKMNNYFPKLCPPVCGLEINFRRIKQNPDIEVLTSTTVESIRGTKDDFTVQLKSNPSYVNSNCTACGECVEVCPEERPNEFNYFLDKTRAIYLPHEMAYPFKYTIDDKYCRKENCGKCKDICRYNAIDLSAGEEISELNVSSVIIATGWIPYDLQNIKNLNYQCDNVVSNVEIERLLSVSGPNKGNLCRPGDNKMPGSIAFAQCAGSRDENYLPYCSAVCCSASLKHALTICERYPEVSIKIFYIDLRVTGRNEDILVKVEAQRNIELIKGKVAKIEEDKISKNIIIEAEDTLTGKKTKGEFEMVVLASGIRPANVLPGMIEKDKDGFIIAESLPDGIYAAACSKKPMDVASSLRDATGIALKAIQ